MSSVDVAMQQGRRRERTAAVEVPLSRQRTRPAGVTPVGYGSKHKRGGGRGGGGGPLVSTSVTIDILKLGGQCVAVSRRLGRRAILLWFTT